MGKIDYLDALKRAMTGLAPATQAQTLAFYEQRFVDGALAGRSEADLTTELGDPKKIAMTLRASVHMQAFETRKNPANFVRMGFAAIGLLIFNLVMVVPAVVYAAVLASLYALGLALYLYGVVITASGLSGATEVKLDGPFKSMVIHDDDNNDERRDGERQTKVAISGGNIQIYTEPVAGALNKATADAADAEVDDSEGKQTIRALRRAEQVATIGVKFNTEMDEASRTTQTFFGFGLVLGGILMLLLCLMVTRYTFIAAWRYIEMNFSLLKGN
ncbi:DUF1700 domain-containing protein [Massilia sp. TWP1-3-3]|uniref:DUF1700 domain-containing protein n=1 Tax=Massilia sp. TWP1-3-3 TaxID=2804573 RepID=UPI003CEABF0C